MFSRTHRISFHSFLERFTFHIHQSLRLTSIPIYYCTQALVPMTREVEVPVKLHRFIIGQKGAGVRRLKEDHDVTIIVPPAMDESNVLQVTGSPANVEAACQAIAERVEQLMEEEEERVTLRLLSLYERVLLW